MKKCKVVIVDSCDLGKVRGYVLYYKNSYIICINKWIDKDIQTKLIQEQMENIKVNKPKDLYLF